MTYKEISEYVHETMYPKDCCPLEITEYNKCLEMCRNYDELLDLFREQKLCHYLGFTGSYDFSSKDMITILKVLSSGTISMRDMESDHFHCTCCSKLDYISLMYCILCDNDLIDYHSTIRFAHITDKGKEILNPNYTDFYRGMLESNKQLPEVYLGYKDISDEHAW